MRLDFGVPPATLPHKRRSKSYRKEGSETVTAVIETRSEKTVLFKKPHSAQGEQKQSAPRFDSGFTLSRMLPKQTELRHSQCQSSFYGTTLKEYEVRRYRAQVAFSAVFRKESRLPRALQDFASKSGSYTRVFLPRSAFIDRKHTANVFFTVKEQRFLIKMGWVCGAH